MRAVVQRVAEAAVSVDGSVVGSVGPGLLVLVGVAGGDTSGDALALADKVAELRIFRDDEGRMNRSLLDTGGGALVVSQFTLLGSARRGRRPSFTEAADPELAEPLVEEVCAGLRCRGVEVASGVFGAMMQVRLVNDGPVTLVIDVEGGKVR